MGLQFVVPERQIDHGYVCRIDRLSYSVRYEGSQKALFVYPAGKPELATRMCGEETAWAILNKLNDGHFSPEQVMEMHGQAVPGWMTER